MARTLIGYTDKNGDFWEDTGGGQYTKAGWQTESLYSLRNKYGPLEAVYN